MSKLKIIVTPTAELDMHSIFDYIAQDNVSKALEMLDLFEAKFEMPAEFPNCGISKLPILKRDVRCFIIAKNYKIFYYVKNDILYIQRVLTEYQELFSLL